MKKFENLGKSLSKEEQKNILGSGGEGGCLTLGAACNDDVQCCSNNCYSCPEGSCPPTGKFCFNSN